MTPGEASEKYKTDLAEASLISFPRSGLPLSLCTDASDFAVGAVLQQLENEDALSRIDSISEINFDEIAEEQTTDEELQQLLHNNSLKLKPSTLPSEKKLWSHPGIKSAVKLMTEKYVWSDIKKQVREWAKACITYQKCKVSRHAKSKLGEFEQPDERFSVVHIDLIGKLPPSEGMQYCLTCID
ncbi:retrovirus-related Pol polyprotein from transposon opus [Trichonephila clavipes]|nr:retrovirus-related Pol polyprotein from transposon opus [Trichonephila clavipes]